MNSQQTNPTAKRGAGRPRRLTLDAIVDAACEIGIARLEMAALAERLQTGVATLYGYVRGRDHLLQLVAERLAGTSMIEDRGQSWQDLLREHAALAFGLFQSNPQLITSLIDNSRDEETFTYSNQIIAMLEARGFSSAEARALYTETSQVVVGAAVCLERRKSRYEGSQPPEGNAFELPAVFGDYRQTLERIVEDQEALIARAG